MFFLLYRHTNDGVYDDFPKISDHFPKISEDFQNCPEGQANVPKRFPITVRRFSRNPKMFRSYTNECKYNFRDKLDISEIIDIGY